LEPVSTGSTQGFRDRAPQALSSIAGQHWHARSTARPVAARPRCSSHAGGIAMQQTAIPNTPTCQTLPRAGRSVAGLLNNKLQVFVRTHPMYHAFGKFLGCRAGNEDRITLRRRFDYGGKGCCPVCSRQGMNRHRESSFPRSGSAIMRRRCYRASAARSAQCSPVSSPQ
jgi:hypothetical protein